MTPHPGIGLVSRLTMERLTNESLGKQFECNTLKELVRGDAFDRSCSVYKGSRLAGSFVVGLVVS